MRPYASRYKSFHKNRYLFCIFWGTEIEIAKHLEVFLFLFRRIKKVEKMKAQFLDRSVGINSSFALQEHAGRNTKKLWHYHPEVELMVVCEGTGSLFVGDGVVKFEPRMIVLIGSNLPHLWQSDKKYYEPDSDLHVRCISIHFNEDFAG